MQTFILHSKHHWVKLFVVLLATLPFSYHCIEKPLDFKKPTWETQLSIPLISRTYYFSDLIKKDSAFTTVNGELIYKPASLSNKPTAINIPTMNPVSALFTRQLGIIPILSVTLPPVQFNFQQLTGTTPPALPWPGPEQNVNVNSLLLGDTASYDYLVYEEGRMDIIVNNTFNFDVNLGLVNLVDTTVIPNKTIGTFNIGAITTGGSKTANIPLNTQRVSSALKLQFVFQTVNMTGKIINNGSLSATLSITKNGSGNPTLSEAKMKLLQEFYLPVTSIKDSVQQIDNKDVVQPIDSTTFIKSATFKGGDFDIIISNGIPFNVIIGFNLREFVNKSTNQSFKLEDPITRVPKDSVVISSSGGVPYTMNVLMKDYKLEARRVNGATDTLTSGVHFSLDIKTLVQSSTKVIVRKTDSVLVQIKPKQVSGVTQPYIIDQVQGKIPPNAVKVSETIKAGIGSSTDKFTADSINFDGAQIVLKIFSKSLFPTDLKFTVKGYSDGFSSDSLSTPKGNGANASPDNISYRIFPGDTAKIIFDKFNPDANGKTIDKFLSSFSKNGKFTFPDSFKVIGVALIEPIDQYVSTTGGIGTVKDKDSIFTSMDFSFPLKIGIRNGSYKDTASISANIPDTAQLNSIKGGKIYFDLFSTFPIGIEVRTKLLKPNQADSSTADKNAPPVLILDTIRINGDNTTGRTGVKSFTFVSLTGAQAAQLSRAAFTAIDLKIGTAKDNGSTPLSFRNKDSITIFTSAKVTFNVDIDRLTEKK